MCDLLEQYGFELVRQRGSHAIMQKQTDAGMVSVPVPMHREIRTGTLQSIIRQSGLPRRFFEV